MSDKRCRECDYTPCMCGRNKQQTDRECREEIRKQRQDEVSNPDAMDPGSPGDW